MNGRPNCANCRYAQIESYNTCWCTYWQKSTSLNSSCPEFEEI